MKEPILITGCARSGTSMIAGIINMCGAFGGRMSGPNNNNAKGMFENSEIRNEIVKPYFDSIGVDRLGQYPLPDIDTLPIPREWRKKVEDAMSKQGWTGEQWMYKGAKMCLHWPVWNYAFPNAKWIIVRRKTPDIINSCIRTGFMRAFKFEKNRKAVNVNDEYDGWLWWVKQHEQRFYEMIAGGLNTMQVWPERMVYGDYTQIQQMLEWLGLDWNSEIPNFIEPKLWKSRQLQKQK